MRPIAELAREHGVSAPSIYLWVARGWLPASLVDRTSRPLRIDGEGFAQMLKRGELPRRHRSCARKNDPVAEFSAKVAAVLLEVAA